ncbi:MAG: DNA polymerase III subunit delta', partial [Flavobacteriales bacterium]|nr:DNA polymerase III subunit delta' [Flavobacteriales bacterium]
MLFSDVLGLDHLKKHLTTSVQNGRIPHAQLFVGQGVLPLAIAYSQYLLCGNFEEENIGGNSSCNLKFNKLTHPDLHFVYP